MLTLIIGDAIFSNIFSIPRRKLGNSAIKNKLYNKYLISNIGISFSSLKSDISNTNVKTKTEYYKDAIEVAFANY